MAQLYDLVNIEFSPKLRIVPNWDIISKGHKWGCPPDEGLRTTIIIEQIYWSLPKQLKKSDFYNIQIIKVYQ